MATSKFNMELLMKMMELSLFNIELEHLPIEKSQNLPSEQMTTTSKRGMRNSEEKLLENEQRRKNNSELCNEFLMRGKPKWHLQMGMMLKRKVSKIF